MEIIKQEWASPTSGNALAQLGYKCKAIGNRLVSWNKTDFHKLQSEMKQTQDQLGILMAQPYSVTLMEEQKVLHAKYSQLLGQEEKYWRQRSRAIYMVERGRPQLSIFPQKSL